MIIQRPIFEKLLTELDKPFVSILIGPRQVGKSFLLKQIFDHAQKLGLNPKYYDLEDPHNLNLFIGDEATLIDILSQNSQIIFIDEFQYLKNATKIFKVLVDRRPNSPKIFASGSSSIEIHKHLKESLAGRYRISTIFPLSLNEIKQNSKYDICDYFKFCGMPGLLNEVTSDDKMSLLNNILQTYLLKDIKSLIKEENIRSFNHLLYLLAQNQGSIVSIANLAREVGLSEPAITKHLEIMHQTFVVFPLASYSNNFGNELKKIKKYYLYDLGIRNSLLKDFSSIKNRQDKGAILESYVFLTLTKYLKLNMELKFWRTRQGAEVDFVLLKDRIPVPIEVKYGQKDNSIPSGIKQFFQRYPLSESGLIITMDYTGDVSFDGKTVNIIKWTELESFFEIT